MVAVCVCVLEIRFALNMKPRVVSIKLGERLFDDDADNVDDDYAKKI